jgi:hypothetical protein
VTGRVLVLGCLLSAGPLYAQTADDRPIRRVEVEFGGGLLGGAGLGVQDANLRANDTAARPYPLFTADSRFGSAPSVHARVGVALSRRLGVEGGVMLSHPEIRTSVSGDAEGAPQLTIVERIDQYVIDAGFVIMIDELRAGPLVPFVAAGAGYLRQLHEGLTVIEHGVVYHAGGGVKHWLLARDRGFVRAAGLRADARLVLPAGGISFDDSPRPRGAISGSLFLSF